MSSKINDKMLVIPPYISTTWSRVVALHMKGTLLAITLNDNSIITIPGLPTDVIESIFNHHAAYLEKAVEKQADKNDMIQLLGNQGAVRFGFEGTEGMNMVMQHNPSQANAPDLPADMLHKISAISKILAPDEAILPKAEPSCNCFHCQIARAINPGGEIKIVDVSPEEVISDKELAFQQWDIIQTDQNLFSVTNRLDTSEKYNVFLGDPIGCTCGKEGCEHIVAVLKS